MRKPSMSPAADRGSHPGPVRPYRGRIA
jgi:hypothetical protein